MTEQQTKRIIIEGMDEDAQQRFTDIVDNIEEREATKERIAEDIKAAYTVAKDDGYDVPALRKLISRRKKMRKDGTEAVLGEEAMLELYIEVVGDGDE